MTQNTEDKHNKRQKEEKNIHDTRCKIQKAIIDKKN